MPCHEFCGIGHQGMWGKVKVIDKAAFLEAGGRTAEADLCCTSKRLILAHFWLAFARFGLALLLGAWQMFVRSPLNAWIGNPRALLSLGHRARLQ